MKTSNFFLALILIANGLTAQNFRLSFPPEIFKVTPPQAVNTLPSNTGFNDYDGSSPALFNHNAIMDITQNLQFFIVDDRVYDMTGTIYTNGILTDNNGNSVYGTQEVCIVPDPATCTKYYVFSSASYDLINWYPTWSSVDVANQEVIASGSTTAQDLRQLMTVSSPFLWGEDDATNTYLTRPGFAATPKRTDGSYLLFVHDGIRHIYRFRIDANGIFYENVIDVPPQGIHDEHDQTNRAEMEIVPIVGGNYRLATVYTEGFQLGSNLFEQPTVYITDLDASGDPILSTEKRVTFYTTYFIIPPPVDDVLQEPTHIHGLEFSPNGQYLYVVHERVDLLSSQPNPIEVIDCTLPVPFPTPIADQLNATNFQYSQIERGVDGNLYIANATDLVSLTNPNSPLATNWQFASPTTINYAGSDELSGEPNLFSYTLPDQIDGENYTAHLNTVECCVDLQNYYDVLTYTYNGNYIEDGGANQMSPTNSLIYIRDEIIITKGSVVTFKNMMLHFAPGAKITIERGDGILPGGFLTLDNCILTVDPNCGPMWNGIEVHGYSNLTQSAPPTSQQGRLHVKNNTLIEHAYIAIAATKFSTFQPHDPLLPPPSPGTFIETPNYGGGIINVSVSRIENCFRGLHFAPWAGGNNNASTVVNSVFETNSPYYLNDPLYIPSQFAYIALNDGIHFRGNDFINTQAGTYPEGERGIGILAIGSKVYVEPRYLPGIDPNTFQNLYAGLVAFNGIGLKPVYCDQSTFDNTFYSIYLSGAHYSIITQNTFNIPLDPLFSLVDNPFGLFLDVCNGYKVEGNDFHSTPVISPTYGVVVANSGIYNNQIYRNNFRDLYMGGQSQGINAPSLFPPTNKTQGLRWKCNTFRKDIFQSDISYASGTLGFWQGICSSIDPLLSQPAGNVFSRVPNNPVHDFVANNAIIPPVTPVIYSHFSDGTHIPLDYTSGIIFPDDCLVSTSDIPYCQSSLGPITVSIAQHKLNMSAYETRITQLESYVDGGNTSYLLNSILTLPNAQCKNLLLTFSPYLSDEVLIAYINHSTNHAHIKQIILANSPISANVWEALAIVDLPEGILTQILAAQTGISDFQRLMGEIDIHHALINEEMNEIIRTFLLDTNEINDEDSVLAILQQEVIKYPELKEMIALIGVGKKDEALIEDTKSAIISESGYTNFCKYLDVALTLNELPWCNYKSTICGNSTLLGLINEIADDSLNERYMAYGRNLRCFALNQLYLGYVEPLNEMVPYNSEAAYPFEPETGEIHIYPNPANEEVNLELFIKNIPEIIRVSIYNNYGQEIQTKVFSKFSFMNFNVSALSSGLYFIKIYSGEQQIGVKKLLVTH